MAKTKKKVDRPSRPKRGKHCQWSESSCCSDPGCKRSQYESAASLQV